MSLLSFLKDAGEKIFGSSDNAHDRSQKATEHVRHYNIPGANNITISYGDDGVATVTGECDSEAVKRMVLVAAGNIAGVEEVSDQLVVKDTDHGTPSTEDSQLYTVKSGDTLSKIAEHFYNDANQYQVIFEANKPMLLDPDKIYPGQTLIIPKR